MGFVVSALPSDEFSQLGELSDEALAERRIRKVRADFRPGYPCRVSLADAEVGDTLYLLNYTHQAADSPYRSSHAIFVREGVQQAVVAPNELPEVLTLRQISVRGFSSDDMIVAADVVKGTALRDSIQQTLANPDVAYIHLHYAKPGCYAARVDRA